MTRAKCSNCGKWAEGNICIEILFCFRTKKSKLGNELVPSNYCKVCSKIMLRKRKKESREKILRERKERRFQQVIILCSLEDELSDWANELLEFSPVNFVKYGNKKNTDVTEKKIIIDLLEGLTESQIVVIKRLVSKGCHPLGFDVMVDEDKIYYMNKLVA